MPERSRSPAISFLGRLALTKRDDSQPTKLEAEVVGLFDQMRGRLLRYALSFGVQIPDAEEILQDVFLALYQHLSGGRSQDGLCGWLFRVTHNLALKRRLAVSRRTGDPMTQDAEWESIQIADLHPNPEVQFAFRQRQDRLRSAFDALPKMDRECLYLRAEGLRYREIADVLGISLGSVANSLARSLARLSAADERLG